MKCQGRTTPRFRIEVDSTDVPEGEKTPPLGAFFLSGRRDSNSGPPVPQATPAPWRRMAAGGEKCPLAGLSERGFARSQHPSVSGFTGVWARNGHGATIAPWPTSTRSSTARPAGPVSTFLTREEAEAELEAVLEDEPAWLPDLGLSRSSSSSASSEWLPAPAAPLRGRPRDAERRAHVDRVGVRFLMKPQRGFGTIS